MQWNAKFVVPCKKMPSATNWLMMKKSCSLMQKVQEIFKISDIAEVYICCNLDDDDGEDFDDIMAYLAVE